MVVSQYMYGKRKSGGEPFQPSAARCPSALIATTIVSPSQPATIGTDLPDNPSRRRRLIVAISQLKPRYLPEDSRSLADVVMIDARDLGPLR